MPNNIEISVFGLQSLVDIMGALPKAMVTEIKQEMRASAQQVYDISQMDVPVDTGNLQKSGHISEVDNEPGADFGYDVTYGDGNGYPYYGEEDGYAWFQELGTRFMSPQPYLGPAFENETQILLSHLTGLANRIR